MERPLKAESEDSACGSRRVGHLECASVYVLCVFFKIMRRGSMLVRRSDDLCGGRDSWFWQVHFEGHKAAQVTILGSAWHHHLGSQR
jgi:hypothetical protein